MDDLKEVSPAEPTARFEHVKVRLPEPILGAQELTAVLGVPQWWPTGDRVAVAIAHDSTNDLEDPLIVALQEELTDRKLLTLRFNFPFAETGKRAPTGDLKPLVRAYRAALSVLGRDPSAAPAHLFLGGQGLGGRVAGQIASSRVRIDGAFFLGFPLHPPEKPDQTRGEELYRIIAPMLFVQGTRDRRCNLDALRRTLGRIGAPVALRIAEDADQGFHIPKRSERTEEEAHREIVDWVSEWVQSLL